MESLYTPVLEWAKPDPVVARDDVMQVEDHKDEEYDYHET